MDTTDRPRKPASLSRRGDETEIENDGAAILSGGIAGGEAELHSARNCGARLRVSLSITSPRYFCPYLGNYLRRSVDGNRPVWLLGILLRGAVERISFRKITPFPGHPWKKLRAIVRKRTSELSELHVNGDDFRVVRYNRSIGIPGGSGTTYFTVFSNKTRGIRMHSRETVVDLGWTSGRSDAREVFSVGCALPPGFPEFCKAKAGEENWSAWQRWEFARDRARCAEGALIIAGRKRGGL